MYVDAKTKIRIINGGTQEIIENSKKRLKNLYYINGGSQEQKTNFAKHILNGIIKNVHRNEKKNEAMFLSTANEKISSIISTFT